MSLLEPGEMLDHYRIEVLIASSGMAVLYKAIDDHAGHRVAKGAFARDGIRSGALRNRRRSRRSSRARSNAIRIIAMPRRMA